MRTLSSTAARFSLRSLTIVTLSLSLLASCAKAPDLTPQESGAVWSRYLSQAPKEGPFEDSMSLRFGREGDTRRVTGLLWGNGGGGLRLDVMAGIGATVAMVSQNGDRFLLYMPMKGLACHHTGRSPLFKAGLPLPLGMADLERLVSGRYAQLFGQSFSSAKLTKKGMLFGLSQGKGGELLLDETGRPLSWKTEKGVLTFSYDADERLANRMEFAGVSGEKAIISVKSRRTPEIPFAQDKLEIALPEGTELLSVEECKRRK